MLYVLPENSAQVLIPLPGTTEDSRMPQNPCAFVRVLASARHNIHLHVYLLFFFGDPAGVWLISHAVRSTAGCT